MFKLVTMMLDEDPKKRVIAYGIYGGVCLLMTWGVGKVFGKAVAKEVVKALR